MGEKLRSGCAAWLKLCRRSRLASSSGLGSEGGCISNRSGVIGPVVDSLMSGGVLMPLFLDDIDLRLEKRRARDDGGGVVGGSVSEEGAVVGL